MISNRSLMEKLQELQLQQLAPTAKMSHCCRGPKEMGLGGAITVMVVVVMMELMMMMMMIMELRKTRRMHMVVSKQHC